MTQEEYINEHPEKFLDTIDKWLYTEFYIVVDAVLHKAVWNIQLQGW